MAPTYSGDEVVNTLRILAMKIKYPSLAMILISLFFCGWAWYNVLSKAVAFDLGTISFFSVTWAHVVGLMSVFYYRKCLPDGETAIVYNSGLVTLIPEEEEDMATRPYRWSYHYRWSVMASHSFVCINYLIGIFAAGHRTGFLIYCSIFSVLWLVSVFVFGYVATKWCELLEGEAEHMVTMVKRGKGPTSSPKSGQMPTPRYDAA